MIQRPGSSQKIGCRSRASVESSNEIILNEAGNVFSHVGPFYGVMGIPLLTTLIQISILLVLYLVVADVIRVKL